MGLWTCLLKEIPDLKVYIFTRFSAYVPVYIEALHQYVIRPCLNFNYSLSSQFYQIVFYTMIRHVCTINLCKNFKILKTQFPSFKKPTSLSQKWKLTSFRHSMKHNLPLKSFLAIYKENWECIIDFGNVRVSD